MSADPPLPADLMVDVPPLDDADLAAYFDSMDPEYDREAVFPEEVLRRERVRGWQITDHGAAQWAGALLALAEDAIRPQQELAAYWHRRIDDWLADTTKKDRLTARLMEGKLADYAVRLRAAGGPATLTLPSVVLRTTAAHPKATVADEDQVAEHMEALFTWAFDSSPVDDPCEEERRQLLAARIIEQLGEGEPSDVVDRHPKVYLAPWRRLVTLGEAPEGWRCRIELDCEHWFDSDSTGLDDVEVPAIGAAYLCSACEPDPIEGPPQRRTTDVTVYEVTRPVVFGPDGVEVPGAEVDPGGVTPKVTARG